MPGLGFGNANCRGCRSRSGDQRTAPVGSFRANDFGLHDMLGNVSEWVDDCWNDNYSGGPSDGRAWISDECSRRVRRGGSWYETRGGVRAASRKRCARHDSTAIQKCDSRVGSSFVGFRVARTLP